MSTGSVSSHAESDAGDQFCCRCGVPVRVRVSNTTLNPGRRFYGCARRTRRVLGCEFFRWVEEEPVSFEDLFRLIEGKIDLVMAALHELKEWQKYVVCAFAFWFVYRFFK